MSSDASAVFVVEDDLSIREGLTNLFRSVGLNVRTFRAANEFLAAHDPHAPGCLVLDVRLPGTSGLDLQRQLLNGDIELPIVFITGHGDIRMSVQAMKQGAVDFLTKPFRDQDLLDAVQQAIERDRVKRREQSELMELRARHKSLSVREREVMALVARGLLNKQIAAELGTAEPTVKLHRGKVMHKMKAESLADLIKMAQKLGM
jgi:FixJ family two-component response regulator